MWVSGDLLNYCLPTAAFDIVISKSTAIREGTNIRVADVLADRQINEVGRKLEACEFEETKMQSTSTSVDYDYRQSYDWSEENTNMTSDDLVKNIVDITSNDGHRLTIWVLR